MTTVKVTVFRWAGAWGPFRVKIPWGECALTLDIIRDTIRTELVGIPVELDVREWLTEWWKPLPLGGWHAPIVIVEDKVISQGIALNRGVLTQAVTAAHAKKSDVKGNHVFGKEGCPYCSLAKDYLEQAGIHYTYHDVIRSPRALYEMLARVIPLIGHRTPVTVPQVWLDGKYIGGSDRLAESLQLQNKFEGTPIG